jgi:hypothetical protein
MHSKDSGKTPEERLGFQKLLNPTDSEPYVDIWRHRHPSAFFVFTWYHKTYRERGLGQRLDYILVRRLLSGSTHLMPSRYRNLLSTRSRQRTFAAASTATCFQIIAQSPAISGSRSRVSSRKTFR